MHEGAGTNPVFGRNKRWRGRGWIGGKIACVLWRLERRDGGVRFEFVLERTFLVKINRINAMAGISGRGTPLCHSASVNRGEERA